MSWMSVGDPRVWSVLTSEPSSRWISHAPRLRSPKGSPQYRVQPRFPLGSRRPPNGLMRVRFHQTGTPCPSTTIRYRDSDDLTDSTVETGAKRYHCACGLPKSRHLQRGNFMDMQRT